MIEESLALAQYRLQKAFDHLKSGGQSPYRKFWKAEPSGISSSIPRKENTIGYFRSFDR